MGAFTKLSYHVVFGTRYRRKTISESISEQLYEYTGGIIRGLSGSLVEMGGVEDHVHLLVNLPPSKSISNCIRDIKANSSKWMSDQPGMKGKFEWQKGYGAFTVSYSQIELVRRYIQRQREHHEKRTFKEEFIGLLVRHDIEYEDKYLFEAEYTG